MVNSNRTYTAVFRVTVALASFSLLFGLTGCAEHNDRWADVAKPQVIAENAVWTWFNDERAVILNDYLFVGYVDTAGYSGATALPLAGGAAQRTRLGSFREVDDHNNPAFVELGDGCVLAVFAPHHTQPYWYWRHAEVGSDSVEWSPQQQTEDLGSMATYSNLFRLDREDDRIYNFFRATNFDPTLMRSDNGGETWSPPQHFIVSGDAGTRPYVKYASNGADRIDIVYTQAHPRQEANDVFHVYYEDGYLHGSDGTRIQPLPGTEEVGPMPFDAGTKICDTATLAGIRQQAAGMTESSHTLAPISTMARTTMLAVSH